MPVEDVAPAAAAEGLAPDPRFRVLPSGLLGFRLPDTKEGKPVWLDVVGRVKLCEHGVSMTQMHHWRCEARPRPKPSWLQQCQCGTKGLFTNPTAKPTLPTDVEVPSYASVLWRDGQAKRLPSTNVLAVRVPGLSKGRQVWMDDEGHALCEHGFSESALTRAHRMRTQRAASLLQEWWRLLGHEERSSVREALLHATPSAGLTRAAETWRQGSERRRRTAPPKRKRGRAWPEPCGCCPGGLRREVFGTMQRPGRVAAKKARADTPTSTRSTLVELSSNQASNQASNQ